MDEEHDGHGCELLADGREAEIGVLINLVERADIGYAIAAVKDRAAIFDDNDSRTGRGRRDVREQGIHLGRFWIGCPEAWAMIIMLTTSMPARIIQAPLLLRSGLIPATPISLPVTPFSAR